MSPSRSLGFGVVAALVCMWSVPGRSPVLAQTAQRPQSPYLRPPDVVAVRAGRLFDPNAGSSLVNQVILISSERITWVGPAAQTKIPPGAAVIDLSSATVLPGLIDSHLHVFHESMARHPGTIGQGRRAYDSGRYYDTEGGWTREERVLMGLMDAQKDLLAGFTTIADLGSHGADYSDVVLRDAINKGLVMGPRMLVSGKRLHEHGFPIDSPAAARRAVQESVKHQVDIVKMDGTTRFTVNPDGTMDTEPAYSLEILQAVVDEANRHRLKVAAHAYGGEGLRRTLEAGVHMPQHGVYLEDEHIALFLKKNLPLSSPFLELRYQAAAESAKLGNSRFSMMEKSWKKAFAAGVKLGLGSGSQGDYTSFPHGIQAEMLEYFVKWGATPAQALRTATINNAEILGWLDRVGSVEPGKYADLIAVAGDPLKDITELQRVKAVIKGGQIVKNDFVAPGAIKWLSSPNIHKGVDGTGK